MMDVEEAMKVANEQLALIDAGELATPQAKQRAAAICTLAAEVRRLSGAVPAGHVRDEKGVDVPFVGTLARTADGCILGLCGNFYFNGGGNIVAAGVLALHVNEDEGNRVVVEYRDTDGDEDVLWATNCYSTRAAAEAARRKE